MADNGYIVSVAKIAGLVTLANEFLSDSEVNVTSAVSTVLTDSLSRDLDLGLLNGAGPPEPDGVIPAAPAVVSADLLAGVSQAVGEIGDAGGTADTLAISGAALAAENSSLDAAGALKYGPGGAFGGFPATVGLKAVVVPALATPLVYDSTRCFLVVNGQDSEVATSNDYAFAKDAATLRVKARVAAGIPAPAKSIRKITAAGTQASSTSTASSKAKG